MSTIIQGIEAWVGALPLPLLEVWGRLAYFIGLGLAVCAYGGLTLRPAGRWGLGWERQAWDARAVLCMPLTFVLIIVTGYLGSFVVLVPGAQTLESLKDLVVFLCIVLFGRPALVTVPFAYGVSDLIEGVPPEFVLDWLTGYFINPACFWLAYQFIGKDPDFRRARTWGMYLLFVAVFLALEPLLWGYLCQGKFTPAISYKSISSALFFTTTITWILAPGAMLAALPLARRFGMYWADIPGRVQERPLGSEQWSWQSGRGTGELSAVTTQGWPIRIVILMPFVALMLLMVGATAYVALRSAEADATKLATQLHQEISENIRTQLAQYQAAAPAATDPAGIRELLERQPVARHGLALVLDTASRPVASTVKAEDPVAIEAMRQLRDIPPGTVAEEGVPFQFDHVTEKPLSRITWMARATPFRSRGGERWTILTAIPETFYLAGVRQGNSRSAMIFALALLLSLSVAGVLAEFVTGRLRRISRATQALAFGDLNQRVAGSQIEELGTLAQSFNEMAARLQRSFDELSSEVDERKKAQQALHDRETFFRLAQEAAHVGSWEWDIPANRFQWSDELARLHGTTVAEFDGKMETVEALCHPDDVLRLREVLAQIRSGAADPDGFERRAVSRAGAERNLWFLGRSQRDEHGKPVKVLGVAIDVTERKQRDLLLAQETRILGMIATGASLEQVLTEIVEGIQELSKDTLGSILLLDADGIHVHLGAAPSLPKEYSGAIEGAAIGPKAGSCGTAAYRRELVIVSDIDTDPLWDDYRGLAQAHSLRACWSTPIFDSHRAVLGTFAMYYRMPRSPTAADLELIQRATHLAGVAIERTLAEAKRKSAEDRLRTEKQFIDTLMDSLPGVVFLFDASGKFLKGNKVLADVTGRSGPELAGLAPLDLVPAEEAAPFARAMQGVLSRGQEAVEGHLLSAGGEQIPYYFKGVRLIAEEGPCVLGIGIDISDQRKLENQFRQAQKMEAVGHLAAGVAHDFNNLLTVITGYSEIMLAEIAPDNVHRECIEEVRNAGLRAAGLTRQLLAFSRQSVLQPKILDVNEVVKDTEKLLKRMIGEDIQLNTVLDPKVRQIRVDPGQLGQVLMNLSVNSRDAMPQGGQLTIETRNISIDEEYCKLHAYAKPGSYVQLSVSDTGEGMSPEVQTRIFEPFFTTKGVGKGTGLGLSMVYGIVKQSGGHVEVYSEIGIGTSFKIYLPHAGEAASLTPVEQGPARIVRGTETILLVEDENALRVLSRNVLRQCGYQVLEAVDGEDAEQVCHKHDGPIHLLVTDVVMPKVGGRVLAERLQPQYPDLRVLYVSGYTDDAIVRHGVLHDQANFLQKPFSPTMLAEKVREVLSAAASPVAVH